MVRIHSGSPAARRKQPPRYDQECMAASVVRSSAKLMTLLQAASVLQSHSLFIAQRQGIIGIYLLNS
jgi:hypothetical protein